MRTALLAALAMTCVTSLPVFGQDAASTATPQPKKAEKLGWSNATHLSLVVTSGNSAARTFGFEDHLKRIWTNARFEADVTALKSQTAGDRYFLVEPGLEFPVGGQPANPASSLITPDPTTDASNFLIGGRYQRDITRKFYWEAGARWDRNDDAGILHRYVVFAGIGRTWADTARRRFTTGYGLSYTDRREEKPDPEKDPRFPGARANWSYAERVGSVTALDSDFAINMNLSDPGDYSIDTTNGVSVSMSGHLALKASVQWLYEHEPALDTDLDVVAHVEVVDPDGLPGTGDEFYRTVSAGGTRIVLGSADARKDRLDTIIRTAIIIRF